MLLGFHVKKDARQLLYRVALRARMQAFGVLNPMYVGIDVSLIDRNLTHRQTQHCYHSRKVSLSSAEHVFPDQELPY